MPAVVFIYSGDVFPLFQIDCQFGGAPQERRSSEACAQTERGNLHKLLDYLILPFTSVLSLENINEG